MIRETDAAAPVTRRYGRLALTVAALFALLYAYDLFEAISNIIGVTAQLEAYNAFAEAEGLNVVPVPWVLLVANIAVAPAVFVVAFVLGRRHGLGVRALAFAAGLALVAAVSLSLAAIA